MDSRHNPLNRPSARPVVRLKTGYAHRFGLVCAFRLDRQGGGEALQWADLEADAEPKPHSAQGPIWIHLDLKHANAQRWLSAHSGIDPLVVDALTAARVTPRFEQRGRSLLLILKGINFRPGGLPMDMVTLRLWSDGERVISGRHEPVRAASDLQRSLVKGQGPTDVGDLICQCADLMTQHMEQLIFEQFDEAHRIGHLHDAKPTEDLVAELAHLRRVMIRMRHFLGPQRRALERLAASHQPWLSENNRERAGEVVHQCTQYIEGLDAAQRISEITQEEILQRSTEKTERRLFSLTVITAIFLPLTFITGLLGVNLAGIPDATDRWAFLLLCLFLGLLVAAQLWYLRRKGWL
ncbi:hypothetical protein CCR96_03650 [Halochromatium roseum]|nr:hypothetical protein [Halochromatium roseum]